VFEGLVGHLNDGRAARSYDCSEEDRALVATSELLSLKPVIYAANLDEESFAAGYETNAYYAAVKAYADREGSLVLPVCAKTEQEIAQLDDEDKLLFLEELGIKESGLDRLIRCPTALGLISFLTAGSDEVRAWTIKNGRGAAGGGKIHSDFERGFIRAEVVAFADLKACGTMAAARERGLIARREKSIS
jgi:ribosome-binding ATPase YchF (GTP1/OBG family)